MEVCARAVPGAEDSMDRCSGRERSRLSAGIRASVRRRDRIGPFHFAGSGRPTRCVDDPGGAARRCVPIFDDGAAPGGDAPLADSRHVRSVAHRSAGCRSIYPRRDGSAADRRRRVGGAR